MSIASWWWAAVKVIGQNKIPDRKWRHVARIYLCQCFTHPPTQNKTQGLASKLTLHNMLKGQLRHLKN